MDRKRATVASSSTGKTSSDSAAALDINKDSFAYGQERDRFLKDLQRFHDSRGSSITRWPYISGKPIDLYALFTTVIQRGGWEKVSNEDAWVEVQEALGLPRACGNADFGLRQIYIRYLHYYEKINHFGQDPNIRDDVVDDDGPSGRRKLGASIGSVSFSYNYQQHTMSESTREGLGLSRDSNKPSDYASLERSLMSGLPNEVDFAMNVCLLLSNEGRHILKGPKGMRVVDCMLSHVGICRDGVASLKCLADDRTALKFLRFWNASTNDRSVKELLCPESLLIEKGSALQLALPSSSDVDEFDDYWESSLGCSLGLQDAEGQRVMQLIMILRNLSFEEENLDILSTDLLMFRFLMLCIHNRYGCIRQLALDTLSNIAVKMTLEPSDCRMTQLVLKTIARCLNSADKLEVTTGLDALGRLCQMEVNEDALSSQLEDSVYERMIALLTLHDIQIVVAVLETLYQLSEIGDVTTTKIAQVTAAVSILVNLLTLEVQAYGPECLGGAKVVEHVVVGTQQQQQQWQAPGPVPVPAAPASCMGPPLRPPAHLTNTPQRPPPLAPAGPALRPAMLSPPVSSECETVACSWLQSQYEAHSQADCKLSRMEMYRRYVSMSGARGLQNIVTPSGFAACIKLVFPSVESETVNHTGSSEVLYRGIVQRQTVLPTAVQGPMSAAAANPLVISLQQTVVQTAGVAATPTGLSTAPGSAVSPAALNHLSTTNCPSIQQALLGSRPPTDQQVNAPQQTVGATLPQHDPSVVRNLLATKLNQNMLPQHGTGVAAQTNAALSSNSVINNATLPNGGSNASNKLPVMVNHISADRTNQHLLNHISMDSHPATSDVITQNGTEKFAVNKCAANSSAGNTNADGNTGGLVNGHAAKQIEEQSTGTGLVNGISSPVPSCSSDDVDPIRDMKRANVQVTGSDDANAAVVVNGVASHDNGDADSDATNDYDDVLSKAMIEADIIGTGQSTADDDDSRMSTDFLSGFLTDSAADAQPAGVEYESEASSAVAGLLGEEGTRVERCVNRNAVEQNGTLPNDATLGSQQHSIVDQTSSFAHRVVSVLPVPPRPLLPAPAPSSQVNVALAQPPPSNQQLQNSVVIVPPGGITLPTGQFVSAGTRLLIRATSALPPQLAGSTNMAAPWNRAPVALTRPAVSVSNTPGIGPVVAIPDMMSSSAVTSASHTSPNCVSAGTVQSTCSIVPGGQTMHFVSAATSQGLVLQRANGPMIQRVLLPQGQRPIIIQRPDGAQVVVQNQQSSVRPVLLAPRPLSGTTTATGLGGGQLHVGQSGVQLVSANQQPLTSVAGSASQQTGQLLLQHGQLVSGPNGQQICYQPATQAVSDANATTGDHNPVLMSQNQFQSGQMVQHSGAVRTMFSPGPQNQMMTGSAAGAPFIIQQQGGRQIIVPSATGQHTSGGYVMIRQGPMTTQAPTVIPAPPPDTNTSETSATATDANHAKGPDSRKRTLPSVNTRSKKKRKADDEVISSGGAYQCEWIGCHRGFDSFMHIYQHVTKDHFEDSSCAVQMCRWAGCDSLPRQRWSFMTHLQDRHLNEASLRHAAEQRRRVQDGSASGAQSQPTPVYPPNAALQAIRRFSCRPPFPELEDPVEGPLTKHIRLTSALILRNLARYSSVGRSLLKRHEQLLAYIALSCVESSLPISHCLQDLHMH